MLAAISEGTWAFLAVLSTNASFAEADTGVLPSSEHDQVILALIALIGTSIAALVYTIRNNALGKGIAVDAAEANRAVNNVGPGEHRLYDLVSRIEVKQDAFDKAWGNLPAEMGDAVGLVSLLHGMRRDISTIQTQLAEHVEWEMSIKWAHVVAVPDDPDTER